MFKSITSCARLVASAASQRSFSSNVPEVGIK